MINILDKSLFGISHKAYTAGEGTVYFIVAHHELHVIKCNRRNGQEAFLKMTKAFVIDTTGISKKSTAFSMILGFGKVSAGSER